MSKIQKQIRNIYTISALSSLQIAGASWVALLAARGFSLVEIGIAEGVFHVASLLFEIPSGVISDVFGQKRSMILSQCMFCLSALLMAFSESLTGICISLIASAFGYNFSSGTREALAYDTLKAGGMEDEYLRYSSTEFTIYRIGNASALKPTTKDFIPFPEARPTFSTPSRVTLSHRVTNSRSKSTKSKSRPCSGFPTPTVPQPGFLTTTLRKSKCRRSFAQESIVC